MLPHFTGIIFLQKKVPVEEQKSAITGWQEKNRLSKKYSLFKWLACTLHNLQLLNIFQWIIANAQKNLLCFTTLILTTKYLIPIIPKNTFHVLCGWAITTVIHSSLITLFGAISILLPVFNEATWHGFTLHVH